MSDRLTEKLSRQISEWMDEWDLLEGHGPGVAWFLAEKLRAQDALADARNADERARLGELREDTDR